MKEQEQALQEQEADRLQRHKEREAEFARITQEREAALSKQQGVLTKKDNQQKEEDQRLKAEATRLQVGPTAPQHILCNPYDKQSPWMCSTHQHFLHYIACTKLVFRPVC